MTERGVNVGVKVILCFFNTALIPFGTCFLLVRHIRIQLKTCCIVRRGLTVKNWSGLIATSFFVIAI